MNIYVIHSSSFDYKNELYEPIKNSPLFSKHHFFFPHEKTSNPTLSKAAIFNKYDLILAEVSFSSTGLGIELGWANCAKKTIIPLCRKDKRVSSSVRLVCESALVIYANQDELITGIEQAILLYS